MANNDAASLLDEWLEHLSHHPRHLLMGTMVVMGSLLSSMGLLIGLLLMCVLKALNSSMSITISLAVFGVLCVTLAWWVDGMTVTMVWQLNHRQWAAIFQGDWRAAFSMFDVLAALPYGIVMGCLFSLISNMRSRIERDVKLVAKGKVQNTQKRLTKKRLDKALAKVANYSVSDGSVLGVDKQTGSPIWLSDVDANLHTLVIGTTGSGKTITLMNIIVSAMQRRWPLILTDGKGDVMLMKQVEVLAKSFNISFYGFSMIGNSLHYNPISSGGYTSKKDRLIELREWSEDHYRKLAEGYLQTVFKVLEQCNIRVDLWTLAKYLEPDKLLMLAREREDKSLIELASSLEEKRKDITGLIAEVQNITQSEIGHLFDCSRGDVIDIEKAIEERGIVYFCLQPLAFPAYAETLGKLIINDIKAVVSKQLLKETKTKLFALFDEFSTFAGEQIINLINQGRSAGVHAVLATQSLSDIAIKGGDALLGQVLNNCNNYIIQRQNNPDDAETLAAVIGTEDGYQVTSQVSTQAQSFQSGTVRIAKEYIVHPDEIKRLGVGEAVMVNKRQFDVRYLNVRKPRVS